MRHLLLSVLLIAPACRDKDTPIDSEVPVADADGDGYDADTDCDDEDPSVNPGAEELCDGLDNNCDGVADEGVTLTFYADADADGYGDDAAATEACEAPEGAVEVGGDCDDSDPAWNPGAVEDDCSDPNDYNCDGSVGYADADGDGWAACEECDDSDAAIHPDATEVCDDIDNDCDGLIDDADESLDSATGATWYADADGDGWGDPLTSSQACEQPSGAVADATDCDDGDAALNNDDADGDGETSCATDCDDGDAAINAAATELCDDVDNDCDGDTDEDDAADAPTWYADGDGDSYGDAASADVACDAPSGHVSDATDCDDADAAVNPAASEVCDDIDNDCDGQIDDADSSLDSSTGSTWYADADGDSEGDASSTTAACEQPSGYVGDASDCDDSDASVNTAATELCDGVDNDCDGGTDEADAADASTWYADSDGDGEGDASSARAACSQPSGYVSDASDCDDGDASINTSAAEVCDSADNDCDGSIDDDAEVLGDEAACAALDCLEIFNTRSGASSGTWWIDPAGSGSAYEAYCEMSTEGGGWTLVATNDFSEANWSETTILDSSTFGSLSTSAEYKSDAWNDVLFEDVLFMNDSMHAAYEGVGDGSASWYDFQAAVPLHNCGLADGYEWPMTATSTFSASSLCSTNLYLHSYDYDGSIGCYSNNNAHGPHWSGGYNNGCPLDDPNGSGFWWYPDTWGSPWTTTYPWGITSSLRMFVR